MGRRPGLARPGRRSGLPRSNARRARAAAAHEAAPAVRRPSSRAARWSSGAPRRFPRAATTRCPSGSARRRPADRRRRRRPRQRPVAQGHPLRHAVGHLRRRAIFAALKADDTSAAARWRPTTRALRASYVLERPAPHAQHAAGLQVRLLAGGDQGRTDEPDRGRLPRRADRRSGGRRRAARRRSGAGVHARRQDHLQQARRGLPLGQRDARRHPLPPDRRRDVPPEVAEFYAHLCPAGVYERTATSWWSTRRTASTARPPTCSGRAGPRARGERPSATAGCDGTLTRG